MTPCFVYFTCSGDAHLLEWSVKSVTKNYPRSEIFVAVDRDDSVGIMKGTTQVVTSFPRNKNLNGTACANGMVQTMLHCLLKSGATHVVKIDSDVVLLDSSLPDKVGDLDRWGTGVAWRGINIYDSVAIGPMYVLSEKVLRKLLVNPDIIHQIQLELADKGPEDVLIAFAADRIGIQNYHVTIEPAYDVWHLPEIYQEHPQPTNKKLVCVGEGRGCFSRPRAVEAAVMRAYVTGETYTPSHTLTTQCRSHIDIS